MKYRKYLIQVILISIIIISMIFLIKNKPFGVTVLKIASNSMVPTFQKGDYIIIKKQKEYNIGDIITYEIKENNKKYLVTHRIINKERNEYKMKGDANNKEDLEKITQNEIIGKTKYIIKSPFNK